LLRYVNICIETTVEREVYSAKEKRNTNK